MGALYPPPLCCVFFPLLKISLGNPYLKIFTFQNFLLRMPLLKKSKKIVLIPLIALWNMGLRPHFECCIVKQKKSYAAMDCWVNEISAGKEGNWNISWMIFQLLSLVEQDIPIGSLWPDSYHFPGGRCLRFEDGVGTPARRTLAGWTHRRTSQWVLCRP